MKIIKDYHGHTLKQTGYGNYPYECIRKDKFPNAMIYECKECAVWDVDTEDNQEVPTMNQEIWNYLHDDVRLNLLIKCGWTNRAGMLTPTGRRIYRSAWVNLSEAARNVIARNYQEVTPMKTKSIFTAKDLELIRVAVQLRREAAMENDEIVEQKKWESILIKIGIAKNYQEVA